MTASVKMFFEPECHGCLSIFVVVEIRNGMSIIVMEFSEYNSTLHAYRSLDLYNHAVGLHRTSLT